MGTYLARFFSHDDHSFARRPQAVTLGFAIHKLDIPLSVDNPLQPSSSLHPSRFTTRDVGKLVYFSAWDHTLRAP